LFAYNAFSQPTTTIAPDGAVVESFTYDAFGNVTAETARDGAARAYTNDSRGLPLTVSDSFGTWTFTHDANQQLTAMTNPAGGITRLTYDDDGRVISIQNPAGQTTQREVNVLDQLVGVTAANGSTYSYTYDALGRLASATDTGGRTRRYEYDSAGRLVRSVDRAARIAVYAYDQDGNLATTSYADGEAQVRTWDPVRRLVSLADADTIVEYAYNDANDLVSERTRGNNGVTLPDVTLAYTTDGNGQRLTSSGPGGVIAYTYDARARLTSLRDPFGGVFALTYDTADRLTGLSRPNGVSDTLAYRENYMVARNAAIGGSPRARAEYTLDPLARRTSLTDLDGNHAFTHDLADRLVSATHPAASGLPAESYTYDAVGNRTSWLGSPLGSVTHNAAMELTRDGTYDYTYDAEGRLTERRDRGTGGITRYTWADAGVLNSITAANGATSTYRYDALGRRLESNENGTVRRFVYSGWNLRNELDGTNALRATYVTGVDLNTVFEIVRDGVSSYPLFDGLKSVVALTDTTGTVFARARYSGFGVVSATGPIDQGVTFTGHQYDAATGLVYARARYYDPTIGRFLSQDPEPAINPYEYASNDPVDRLDPTGRAAAAEYETEDTFISGRTVADNNAIARARCYFSIAGKVIALFAVQGQFSSPFERQLADQVAERLCTGLYGPPRALP
jgi:RHS repeat-associated protein